MGSRNFPAPLVFTSPIKVSDTARGVLFSNSFLKDLRIIWTLREIIPYSYPLPNRTAAEAERRPKRGESEVDNEVVRVGQID